MLPRYCTASADYLGVNNEWGTDLQIAAQARRVAVLGIKPESKVRYLSCYKLLSPLQRQGRRTLKHHNIETLLAGGAASV